MLAATGVIWVEAFGPLPGWPEADGRSQMDVFWDAWEAVWKSPVCRVHRQFFTKSFLGDDAAVLAPSSGEERAPPRHRASVASMAWRTTRRFSTNAP